MYKHQEGIYQNLYKEILRLRLSEDKLASLYKEFEMRTPTHFGTGQEAIAVGVCQALLRSDVVYSHHRCHNHYLAKGGSFYELTAELYGREGGCSKGRGGSVHLTARDKGFVISSAILAQTIANATGSALAFKMDKLPNVAVTFFGDAACEEGACYESFNYAAIHQLPVLYVCENNLYSTESPLSTRQPVGTSLAERANAFKIPSEVIDGNDVFTIFEVVQSLLPRMREGHGPFFLECMTYRWREHVGPNFDYETSNRNYRSELEQKDWIENRCPVKKAENYLIEKGFASSENILAWKLEIEKQIEVDIQRAKESPWPEISELYENVY